MAKGSDYDPHRTVILPSNSDERQTAILPQPGSTSPGGQSGMAPTQVLGPNGILQAPLPPPLPPAAQSKLNVHAATVSEQATHALPQPSGARPGYAAATQILMPGANVSGLSEPQAGLPAARFDPVIGWLVVLSGPGRGEFRHIRYGNNTIGRDHTQRIPLNFGDTTISADEQAYLRYQPETHRFILIPNMSKANVVKVNDDEPFGPVELKPHDVIRMGITKLLFVPLCGPDFEWSKDDTQP